MSAGLFIECIKLWWDPSYSSWIFFALFLPVTLLVYSLCKSKHRYHALLIMSWLFFLSLSGAMFFVHIAETVLTWRLGLSLKKITEDSSIKRKEKTEKKKKVLLIGVLILVAVLYSMKYLKPTNQSI